VPYISRRPDLAALDQRYRSQRKTTKKVVKPPSTPRHHKKGKTALSPCAQQTLQQAHIKRPDYCDRKTAKRKSDGPVSPHRCGLTGTDTAGGADRATHGYK